MSFKQYERTLSLNSMSLQESQSKTSFLARISCYMGTEKLKQVMQAFFLSHFSCSLLIWMFYDGTSNHRVNHIHEIELRFAYKDYQTDFGSLLEQWNLVFIHVKNLQLLMTEVYEIRSGLSPPFVKDIIADRNTGYDARHGNDSQLPKVHTTTYGIETISFLGHRL